MAIQFDAAAAPHEALGVGQLSFPAAGWSMVEIIKLSPAAFAFNHLLSNGNPGTTNTINMLYTSAFALALNIKTASYTLDSTALTATPLQHSKYMCMVTKRVVNNIEIWVGYIDSVNGNTAPAKIYTSPDCSALGDLNDLNWFVSRRDGAYDSQTARGDFYAFGHTNQEITTSMMNSLMTGTPLTSLGVTWNRAIEATAVSGAVTTVDDHSENDATITVYGSPVYVANPVFPEPAITTNVGWVSPVLYEQGVPVTDGAGAISAAHIFVAGGTFATKKGQLNSLAVTDSKVTIDSDILGEIGDTFDTILVRPSGDLIFRNQTAIDLESL